MALWYWSLEATRPLRPLIAANLMTERFIRTGPLSFCQELLLLSEILQGCAPTVSRLVRIDGDLDIAAFAAAAQSTIAAHEPLRSICIWRSGEPRSQVSTPEDVALGCQFDEVRSGRDLTSFLRAVYDPATFAAGRVPQMRHSLVRVQDNAHLWAFGVHHMAADAISLARYAETFRQSYAGVAVSPRPTASIEYAETQRAWLSSCEAQIHFEWWLRMLDAIDPEPMPVKAPVPSPLSGRTRRELRLAGGGRSAVVRRAREWRVPQAAIFLAAFARTIAKRRSTSCVTVLTNVPGRSLPGASDATGAFYNTVPLPLPTQAENARSASAVAAEALFQVLERQEVPAPLLSLGALRRGAAPLAARFPITFNVVEHPLAGFRLSGCRIRDVDIATLEQVTWDSGGAMPLSTPHSFGRGSMDWLISVLPSALVIVVEYDADQCDPEDLRSLMEAYGDEIHSFMEFSGTQQACDPSLVADWRSP